MTRMEHVYLGWGLGGGERTLLLKLIDEYALHSGQAHMLRFAAVGKIIR